jgi:magnesium chelatase family protein
MNPCPCGYLGDLHGDCGCSAERVANYRSKISGPLLDRIDMHVEVGRPPRALLRTSAPDGENSADVMVRVVAARRKQIKRAGVCNARLQGKDLTRDCELDDSGWQLLDNAADKFTLSVRSYQRILRVARTIADLADEQRITPAHIAEAMTLRGLQRR